MTTNTKAAIDFLLGDCKLSQEAIDDANQKRLEKETRRRQSMFNCSLPDWTGQGGMQSFWLNKDGTYESMDSRIDDEEIRRGMELLSRSH